MLIIVTGAIERGFRFIFAQKQQPTQLAIYNLNGVLKRLLHKNSAIFLLIRQKECTFATVL